MTAGELIEMLERVPPGMPVLLDHEDLVDYLLVLDDWDTNEWGEFILKVGGSLLTFDEQERGDLR